MRYAKFLACNILGGIGWVLSMVLLGFFLGEAIPDIEKKIHWVVGAVIVLSFIPIIREWYASRRKTT